MTVASGVSRQNIVWALLLLLGMPGLAHALEAPPTEPRRVVIGLEEALATTVRLLPALALGRANEEAAMARTIQARSLMLPALTGSLGYTRQTANFVLRPGTLPSSLTGGAAGATKSRSRSYNYWNTQLQLSQLLFDFGSAAYSLSASRALARQSSSALQQAVLEATLATRKAFFNAQGTALLCRVAQQTLDNQLRHKQQISGQVAVGQRPPIDLAQADTDVSQARVSLITAQNNSAIAQESLMQAMGVEGLSEPFAVNDDTLPPVAAEDQEGPHLLAQALGARPEMAGLHEAFRAQRQKLRSLQTGLLPQISAAGSATDAGQDIGALGWNWSAQALLSWPLLSGGNSVGQMREAQAMLRAAQANLNTTRNAIALELQTAKLNVNAAKLSLAAAQDGIKSASYQLTLAEGRYSTGLGGVIELGDAQLAWATANSQEVQARVGLATARASLLKALGQP